MITLDTILAVGDGNEEHNLVETFTLSAFEWQIKPDYPYAKDTHHYAVLGTADKKFIIFGGRSRKRTVLTN